MAALLHSGYWENPMRSLGIRQGRAYLTLYRLSTSRRKLLTDTRNHFSPRATLAAIGLKLRMMGLLSPIKEKVKIAQKTIKHEPIEKLQDALITILASAHG